MSELVEAWRQFSPSTYPFVLPADRDFLLRLRREPVLEYSSFEEYRDRGLADVEDDGFHLGLLPTPWFGDPDSASVYYLLLNPGFNPIDYYSQYRIPEFRQLLERNLANAAGRSFPLLHLDPDVVWHSGARYFRPRLGWLARELVAQRSMMYVEALQLVASKVCCLQLIPYHSVRFTASDSFVRGLPSARLAREHICSILASRPDVLIIVSRAARHWGLTEAPNVVVYSGGETRSAQITPATRGGAALAAHFGIRLPSGEGK